MKQFITLSFSLLLIVIALNAQTYSLITTTETYTDLSNPVSLNNGDVWEMPDYVIPIGFDFWYFNSTTDTLYFFETAPAMLSSSNEQGGFHKIIIPFGASLVDRGYETSHSLSPLSYELTGDIGNRIFKMEWKNVGFLFEFLVNNTLNDYANFQLWLYETTGNIEMHYGPSQFTHPELAFADETGPSVALISKYDYEQDTISSNSLWLQGNPSHPSMIESDYFYYLDGAISPNTVYQFNNLTVGSVNNTTEAPVVYPNPVVDRLNLRMKNFNASPVTIIIWDMTGRSMYNASISPNEEGEIQIPVSDLNTGIYQLIFKQGQETYTSRFVKL
jgi:hypothetical protein